jgi:hypothetical protein
MLQEIESEIATAEAAEKRRLTLVRLPEQG